MMRVCVLSVGKAQAHLMPAVLEYQKRLSGRVELTLAEMPDRPEPKNASPAELQKLLHEEGETLLSRIKPGDFVIALALQGEVLDSLVFAERMQKWAMEGKRIVFVIGGSNGLSQAVLLRANVRWSLSALTFPHALAKVLLLEQLYRAVKIAHGEIYHK